MDLVNSFIAGWVGGVGNLLVGHPFDTVKTLMQDGKGETGGAVACAARVVQRDGPLALYKGVLAPMSGVGVVFALYFLAYDTTEKVIRKISQTDPNTPLTMPEVIICGGSTGFLGSLVLGPAELLKIRQQTALNSGREGSLRGVITYIYRKEGLRGFFRGTGATMLRDIPGSMAWFGAYEYTKMMICANPKAPTVPEALFAGGVGGLGMWSFAIPLDAIKTRVQASHEGLTPAGAVRAVFKESGIKGFYRGIGPALLRAFPANAACFAAKEYTLSTLNRYTINTPQKK